MTMLLPPRTDDPTWVRAWHKARAVGDFRPFVEQIPMLAEFGEPIPSAPFTDKGAWVQPGEYGYEGCPYDFNAPPEHNRLCAMHPEQKTAQPLKRTVVGSISLMLCVDCHARYMERIREQEMEPDWRSEL